jgi:hypothetical protein|tara:strand:+ start:392 stop:610 length:219 start_codon:yes stop_codon:yes gene_type:complete
MMKMIMKTRLATYKGRDPKKILLPSTFGRGSILKIAIVEAMNIPLENIKLKGERILKRIKSNISDKGPAKAI